MEYIIRPVGRLYLGVKELWEYRELFYFFTWRDIKVRYKQTVLGAAWAIVQPLLMTLVFTLFFGRTLGIDSGSLPYPLFVFPGMMIWTFFSNGLTNSSGSMLSSANIIKKIYFPRLIIPISSILAAMVDLIISMAILIILLIYYGFTNSLPSLLLALPFSLALTLLTLVGSGCFFAALNIKYRDFRYVIPFLLQVLFFMTPVIYPARLVPIEWVRSVLQLNPVGTAIDLLRQALSGGTPPLDTFLLSFAIAITFFLSGIYYFRKTEYYFADLA